MNQYDQLSLLCATVGIFKKAATVTSRLIFNDSRLLQCKPDRVICILPCIQQDIKIWIILFVVSITCAQLSLYTRADQHIQCIEEVKLDWQLSYHFHCWLLDTCAALTMHAGRSPHSVYGRSKVEVKVSL